MPNSSEAGQEPCPCDNLKYGPPDANGRRTIFIPETAWADEPLPPMPRDYGLEPSPAESRDTDQSQRLLDTSTILHSATGPENGERQMSTRDDLYISDHNQGPRSTFLGESAAGGPFGSRTLAQLGMVQLPDRGAGPELLQAGAGDAAQAGADMLGSKIAAEFMATYILANKGKEWCEDVDFAVAWAAMLDGKREDCTVLAGADQILCNVRNEQKDQFEKTYKLVGLTSKGAWYWDVRRKFIELCKEKKRVYDQSTKR